MAEKESKSIKNLKPRMGKKSHYKQGYFDTRKSKKYVNPNNEPCIYRSGLEFKFMVWCEAKPFVVTWTSEPFPIKYFCLSDGKEHTYWVDFQVSTDKPEKWMIEVKPEKEINEATEFGRIYKALSSSGQANYAKAHKRAARNYSKWVQAKKVCEQNGYRFILVSEKFLNRQ